MIIFYIRGEYLYNLVYTSEFTIPPILSHYHGSEPVDYLGLKSWERIPRAFWQIDSFSGFGKAIKNGRLITDHVELLAKPIN